MSSEVGKRRSLHCMSSCTMAPCMQAFGSTCSRSNSEKEPRFNRILTRMRKLAKNSHKDLQPSTSRLYMESGRRRAFPQARLNLSSTSAAPEQQSNNLIRALPDSQIPAAGRTAVNVAVAARLQQRIISIFQFRRNSSTRECSSRSFCAAAVSPEICLEQGIGSASLTRDTCHVD